MIVCRYRLAAPAVAVAEWCLGDTACRAIYVEEINGAMVIFLLGYSNLVGRNTGPAGGVNTEKQASTSNLDTYLVDMNCYCITHLSVGHSFEPSLDAI